MWVHHWGAWRWGGQLSRGLTSGDFNLDIGKTWNDPNSKIRAGCNAKFSRKGDANTLNNFNWFFNAATETGVVGGQFLYDHAKKSGDAEVGTQIKNADHTWKFRLNSSGMARAAL